MPQQTEQNANNALGALLRRMLPRYDVLFENTQQIVNHPGLRPDVLITAPGRSPVVIEAEYMPAFLADADANRALLDRRVICDLLGFDEDTYQAVRRLSAKWCAEPSVHGGKKRPSGAKLVS